MQELHKQFNFKSHALVSSWEQTNGMTAGRVSSLGQEEIHNSCREDGCFSIFVDNVPPSVSKGWLKEVFEPMGSIVDIFIAKRPRCTTATRFVFAGFIIEKKLYELFVRLTA